MRLDFAELTVRYLKDGDSSIHGIFSITNQCAFVTVEVVKVKEVAPSGCVSVNIEPGKTVKPDMIVEGDDED